MGLLYGTLGGKTKELRGKNSVRTRKQIGNMKSINFVDSEQVKVSEEGGRVSSEGSFTDCTHHAFLDKT